MRFILLLLCLSVITTQEIAQAQVNINITGSPSLPVANLLKNPGFELGGALPDDWVVEEQAPYFRWSREPWRYNFQRMPSGGRIGACLRLDVIATSVISEEALRQRVPVEPGQTYEMGAWVRSRGGLAWVHVFNSDLDAAAAIWKTRNSLANSPLVSDFVPVEWTDSPATDEWFWLGTQVKARPTDKVLYLELSCYQERGSMDFDDALVCVANTELTVKVDGAGLKKVTVQNDAGVECWNSGDLTTGTTSIEHTLPQVSTQAQYEVIVTTADGKEIHKWYPEAR